MNRGKTIMFVPMTEDKVCGAFLDGIAIGAQVYEFLEGKRKTLVQ